MPPTITAMPHEPEPAGTSTTPTGDGWLDAAWAEINEELTDAEIRGSQASYALGNGRGPLSLLLPHHNPVAARIRAATLADDEEMRRQRVRDLAGAMLPLWIKPVDYCSRLRFAKFCQTHEDLTEARNLVGQYAGIWRAVDARFELTRPDRWVRTPAAIVILMNVVVILLFAAPIPGCLALGATVAYLGLHAGWRRGYHYALWHCAEVHADHALKQADQRDQQEQNEIAMLRHQATRRLGFKLPRPPRREGYLYVIEFSTGSVKVGLTEDPKRRLGEHLGEARAFGVHITNYWISPSCHNFKGNETRLINACTRISKQRSRKEYFHDVPYKTAGGFANDLTYFSKNTDQTSVEGVWS